MTSPVDSFTSSRRLVLLLFVLFLFSYGMFKYYIEDPMVANRTSLALALIEEGSVCIDSFHQFSGSDICLRDGHYYCDKAPGATFLSLPTYFLGYHVLKALGKDDFKSYRVLEDVDPITTPKQPGIPFQLLILVGSINVSIVCALAVALMYPLGRRLGASPRTSLCVCLLLGLGSMYAKWATIVMGHALAGALLLLALVWAFYLLRPRTPEGAATLIPSQVPAWCGVGFLLAYSFWTEYTTAIPAVILGFAILGTARGAGFTGKRLATITGLMILGAVPAAIGFFVYNNAAFGSPTEIGYRYVETNFPGMNEGFYGMKLPRPLVILKTLVHTKHGILWITPALVLFPYFAYRNIRDNRYRALNIACVLIVVYYFCVNSSYVYWYQVYFGPRHCTPCLPFAVIPLLTDEKGLSPGFRKFRSILIGASILIGLMSLFVPASSGLFETRYGLFYIADCFVHGRIRNMLYYLGLGSAASMVVIFAVWIGLGLLIRRRLLEVEGAIAEKESNDEP